MDELKSTMEEHIEQMAGIIQKFTAELRSEFRPACENFMAFFHAIHWKEPWLICLLVFHVVLLLIVIISRKNTNFQMCFFLLALAGVYFAERLNRILASNWKSFAGQNYFDPHGLFLSVLWSGPLLLIAIAILVSGQKPYATFHHFQAIFSLPRQLICSFSQVNTLFSLCQVMVRWKKAELKHRARLARNKQD